MRSRDTAPMESGYSALMESPDRAPMQSRGSAPMGNRRKRPIRWGTMLAVLLLALGAAACAGLLGLRPAGPQPFAHRSHVQRGIPCVQCHVGIEEAGERGPLHLPDTGTCLGCHTAPHDTRPCLPCHSMPFIASDAAQARHYLRFDHSRHLGRMHGNCVRCHVDVARPGALLAARMGTCLGCHEHEREFLLRDCSACHEDLPAELTRPESHMVHGDDFVRSHGGAAASSADLCGTCHGQRFCADCHGATAATLPWRMAVASPLRGDVHRAGFMARHAEEARTLPGTCTTCHDERSCAACHGARGVATGARSGSPHPPGWVGVGTGQNQHGRAARRDPASCASCHGGAGEMLCVECHRVGGIGGSPHPPGWSSRKRMSEAPCRLCHPGVGP